MNLDPSRFPRAAAYLRSLPHGLDSYPECRVKTNVLEHIAGDVPALASAKGLPTIVLDVLDGSYREEWLPEVTSNVLLLAVRDVGWASDDEFRAWARRDSARVFARPAYKFLMLVLSPALVVMGTAKRWGAFHEGTQLSATPVKRDGDRLCTSARLTQPSGLFTGLLVDRQAQAFLAALDGSRAREPEVKVTQASLDEVRFVASWQT